MQTPPARLLVVEDDDGLRRLMVRRLEAQGFEVSGARDGIDALVWVDRHHFDLVLLDVRMPMMGGLEVLSRLRADYTTTELPVIMVTGMTDSANIVTALEHGANDYIAKPVDFSVLQARIRSQVGLKRATDSLNVAYQRIKHDLEAAARVQRTLLPQLELAIPGLELEWAYRPCEELAGDILNILPLDDEHLALYLLDVSGHGVQAALLCSTLSHVLSTALGTETVLRDGDRILPPSEVARRLNRRFPMNLETFQYFTLLYGILHLPTRRLHYVSAGHPAPVILRAGGELVVPEETNAAIGFTPEGEFVDVKVALEPGDRVFLFSDGIFEAANEQHVQFGLEQLTSAIRERSGRALGTTVQELMDTVESWSDGRPQDDISLIALGVEQS